MGNTALFLYFLISLYVLFSFMLFLFLACPPACRLPAACLSACLPPACRLPAGRQGRQELFFVF